MNDNEKECLVHGIGMVKRTGKDGKTFWSHGHKRPDGTLIWCSGYGWKNPFKWGPRYLENPDEIDPENKGVNSLLDG
jgi:hypothetical protein